MDWQLYQRRAVTGALVPRLVGLASDRRARIPYEHPDDLPVVLLTGGHGMGRTAVLDNLTEVYRERSPVGRADLAGLGTHGDPPPHVANTSAVVEVLVRLVEGLALHVPGFGRLRFDRLVTGLVGVSGWHHANEREPEIARDRVSRLFEACGYAESDGAEGWMRAVRDAVPDDEGNRGDADALTESGVRRFLTRHLKSRRARAVADWYGGRVEHRAADDDGVAPVVRLCTRFYQGGDPRQTVERTLTAALLDDLADCYTGWRRLNRAARPLALLDNVHTPPGRALLGLLLEHRADAERGDDPLVIVASHLGGISRPADGESSAFPHACHRTLQNVVSASGWSRDTAGSRSAGLLVLPLPPLSRDDVVSILDDLPGRPDPYIHRAVHHVTRGNPLGVRCLCDAVLQAAESPSEDPDPTESPEAQASSSPSPDEPALSERLLDLPAPGGGTVTERLLEELVPTPRILDVLVVLSSAEDRTAAEALAERYVPWTQAQSPVDEAARYLEEERWTSGDGNPPFVTDPFLRTLLVQQLRSGRGEGAPAWEEVHGFLREHYRERASRFLPSAQRSLLACGDTETVVRELAADFSAGAHAEEWLRALRHIAHAPRTPSPDWPGTCREIARGARDFESREHDSVRRCVNRLLHGLWYLADELTVPHDDILTGVKHELVFVSMSHPSGRSAFVRASMEWPAAAREKKQWPL